MTARLLTLLTAVFVWPWLALAAGGDGLADAVKAAYLVKFGAFVEWPAGVFPASDSPFKLCIAGGSPFGGVIDRAARGEAVGGHAIVVQHFVSSATAAGCQLLFLPDSSGKSAAGILAAVRGIPVLTVTDLPASAEKKGIINFVIRDNHVRFEIDDRRAGESGLRISSQLMALAVR